MDFGSLGLKILVADDSPVYRRLVQESLTPEKYCILFAKDGREAMALFAEYKPAVLITDWTMPDISGIELCQAVRRELQESYPYIILLTSHTEKEQLIEGLAAGADDYLTKPFHPGELQARVRVGHRIADLHQQLWNKNRQLAEMALMDPLTCLPNRRAIDTWAAKQLSGAGRHNFSVWVTMADLDHFKNINDTYGHDAGDLVLKDFAEILRLNTRQSNICGRLGGEEFLSVITHVEEKENVALAIDRIRGQFEDRRFTSAGRHFQATASFGIAGFRGTCPVSFDDLVKRADGALYTAKRGGRNRIEFAMG